MKTVFLRALDADDKAEVLRAAIRKPEAALGRYRFEVDTTSFAAVPRSPFAYWVSERLRRVFEDLPPFETDGRRACVGDHPGDGFRFLALWYEISPEGKKEWTPYQKGGVWSQYYCDIHLVADWNTQRQTYRGFLGRPGRTCERPSNFELFFRPGLTWPRRTTSGLSLRIMPAGCIFADKGPAAFVENDNSEDLLALLALANSRAFAACVDLQLAAADAAARSYEVGVIQRTPVPQLCPPEKSILATLARRSWSLKRRVDNCIETSHAFILPALLQLNGDTLATRAGAFADYFRAAEAELAAIQGEIDVRCRVLYDIDEADQRAIRQGLNVIADEHVHVENDTDADADTDRDENGESGGNADGVSRAAQLVSWAVGVAFGRFDVRLATGMRPLPTEPEPFDPLPMCSPAMLIGDDGLPLISAPAGYPLVFPENGILVDDPGHPRDLTAAVRVVFDEVFKANAYAWCSEAGTLLDPKDHDLRTWLASNFFEHHVKRYSKSRRKAPILWQLAVPSGRYSVWLYAHRLTRDSFFQIQNDVVTPKLAHEERQLANLMQGAGVNPSAKERKEISAQEVFIQELRAMLSEVKLVAPLWNPILDDGVVLTMAPLWRLVPHHKAWQRELKTTWGELAAGKYDWAHLAMHLWPERVTPKCATDRSLAIAHGLEDVFWVEGDDTKWKPRPSPTRTIDELVRERTSTAVNAALKSLLEAPVANANGGRRRGRQATADKGAR